MMKLPLILNFSFAFLLVQLIRCLLSSSSASILEDADRRVADYDSGPPGDALL